jgi:hypothetical protein
MTQGLLLFDANKRVLICNQRYIDLYGVSPKIVQPGATLRDVLRHRIERGSLIRDVDEYCDRVERELSEGGRPFVLGLADGRFIQIIDRPMTSGGWVSTHEDITERRLFEQKIERLAHYDILTGLPNRGLFLQRLASELAPTTIFTIKTVARAIRPAYSEILCSARSRALKALQKRLDRQPIQSAGECIPLLIVLK